MKEFVKDIKDKNYGDAIERITKATGIKKAVEAISEATGVDCGCDDRKERWNYGKTKNEEGMKLYIQQGCPHCDKVEIPEFLDVKLVDINAEDYDGFRPQNVPVLQFGPITIVGDKEINNVLASIKRKDA